MAFEAPECWLAQYCIFRFETRRCGKSVSGMSSFGLLQRLVKPKGVGFAQNGVQGDEP